MTASVGFLAIIISVATAIAAVFPIILLVLWLNDWKRKKIW